MKYDPYAAAYNAITNCTRDDVTPQQIEALLRTGDGPGHLVRGLFEGCAMETLERLAMHCGLSSAGLRQAMRTARARHGAANADLMAEDERAA